MSEERPNGVETREQIEMVVSALAGLGERIAKMTPRERAILIASLRHSHATQDADSFCPALSAGIDAV